MLNFDALSVDPFDLETCKKCHGIAHPVYLECVGFTTDCVQFICPECEEVTHIRCDGCNPWCKFWGWCSMRETGTFKIIGKVTHRGFFGSQFEYFVTWNGRAYDRLNTLKDAVESRERMERVRV